MAVSYRVEGLYMGSVRRASGVAHAVHGTAAAQSTPGATQYIMSDNEYGDGEGGEGYDVFANEDDDPQMEEPAPDEADPADMEVVDPADVGGAGLRSADERITTKYMTKYERARILGTRALQIRCVVFVWMGWAVWSPRRNVYLLFSIDT